MATDYEAIDNAICRANGALPEDAKALSSHEGPLRGGANPGRTTGAGVHNRLSVSEDT